MTKLKLLTAKQLEKALLSLGFEKLRQKGSHVFYKHADGRRTTIPHHQGKIIVRPLLRAILREISIDLEGFNKLLEKIKL